MAAGRATKFNLIFKIFLGYFQKNKGSCRQKWPEPNGRMWLWSGHGHAHIVRESSSLLLLIIQCDLEMAFVNWYQQTYNDKARVQEWCRWMHLKWISVGLTEQVCTLTLLGYVISLSKLTAPCCWENTYLLVLVNTTTLPNSLCRQEKITTGYVTRLLLSYCSWAPSACPDGYLQIGGGHRGCIRNMSPTQFLKPHRKSPVMAVEQFYMLENH